MEKYLDKHINMWKKEKGTFPTVCFDEDINTQLFVGEPNNDDYIEWNYQKIDKVINFKDLENKYKILLHDDIKEYYNSFYFMEIEGFFEDKSIYLDGIYDKEDIINNIEYSFEENNGSIINIGMVNPESLPLCFDNQTGNIIIYDYERDLSTVLCKSFVTLFNKMNPLNSK